MTYLPEGHMRPPSDMLCLLLAILALLHSLAAFAPAAANAYAHSDEVATMPRLRVSTNCRFLVTEDGRPFFWLGDTAWRLSVLAPDEVDVYMESRVRHAFNVVQVHPGLEHPDFAGNLPFLDGDPERPNEAFWRHIDYIVAKAREHELYVALVPLWGQEYAKAFRGDVQRARVVKPLPSTWTRSPVTVSPFGGITRAMASPSWPVSATAV